MPGARRETNGAFGWRAAGLVFIGLVLAWVVLTRSLAASVAKTWPEAALALQPHEPRALMVIAEREVRRLSAEESQKADAPQLSHLMPAPGAQEPSPIQTGAIPALRGAITPDGREARTLDRVAPERLPAALSAPPSSHGVARDAAAGVIAADPLNAGAVARLGDIARHDNETESARRLMTLASRLSVRESGAVAWLLQDAIAADDRPTALLHADALLRTRGRAVEAVVPILARLAETGDGTARVAALLARDPPWRAAFFHTLGDTISDARTPLNLMLHLRTSDHPPQKAEILSYVRFLLTRDFHELAYYTWLQFLPPEELDSLDPLRNGDFEVVPDGSPFDWSLAKGSGVTAEIRPIPDQTEEHALRVEFTQGRIDFPGISQTLLLGPGTYTLKGRVRGALAGKRGLVWRLQCAGRETIAQTDLLHGELKRWREFSMPLEVPASGCRAQALSLVLDARSASEQFVTGALWFDDLAVERGSDRP